MSDNPQSQAVSGATVKRVGVVGLGHMGHAFAVNLVQDGYEVLAYDRDVKRAMALSGARPKTVARSHARMNGSSNRQVGVVPARSWRRKCWRRCTSTGRSGGKITTSSAAWRRYRSPGSQPASRAKLSGPAGASQAKLSGPAGASQAKFSGPPGRPAPEPEACEPDAAGTPGSRRRRPTARSRRRPGGRPHGQAPRPAGRLRRWSPAAW